VNHNKLTLCGKMWNFVAVKYFMHVGTAMPFMQQICLRH